MTHLNPQTNKGELEVSKIEMVSMPSTRGDYMRDPCPAASAIRYLPPSPELIETKRSSLKTSSQEKLSLTGILGQIRIKDRKDLWETLLLKIWTNLEKLVPRCPTSSLRCIPIRLSREHCRIWSWRWRSTKSAGFTTVKAKSRGSTAPVKPACNVRGERSKCKSYSNWSKRMLDVKFASGTESIGETCCNVFIRKRKNGKPIQEFCFQTRWPVKSGKIPSWRQ